MSDNKAMVDAKITRLKAAVNLEAHDRVPLAAMADFWPVRYSQYTMQEAFYNMDVAAECYKRVFSEWDLWDAFNPLMNSLGPFLDATGSRRYNVPGRDLPPHAEFQHPDLILMETEEYAELIANPPKFLAEKAIPRLCRKIGSESAYVRGVAWAKAALFFAEFMSKGRSYAAIFQNEYGIPPLFRGQSLYVPLDWLADKVRGFRQGMLDVKERPEEVAAACEALAPFIVDACLAGVPEGDYPLIFNPQHMSPFLSPRDYQRVYWPTFKKIVDEVVQRGYKLWVFFEDKQEHHLECFQELPKGKVVACFESTDLAKAKKALGGRLCIAGGMPTVLLTRATPQEVKEQTMSVLKLFEDEPGFIMTCTTVVPSTARPENLHAWLNTTQEYGRLGGGPSVPARNGPTEARGAAGRAAPIPEGIVTSWEAVRPEFGQIQGDENIIKENWENLEKLSLTFLYWMVR